VERPPTGQVGPPEDLPPPPRDTDVEPPAPEPAPEGGRGTVPAEQPAGWPAASAWVAAHRRPALAASVLALLLGVTVAAAAILRGSTVHLLARVPSGVDAVVVLHLDPSAAQKLNLARIRSSFPQVDGDQELLARLRALGDELFAGTGIGGGDLLGWVGPEVVAAVDVAEGEGRSALLVAVADETGARTMLAKLQAPGAAWEGVGWSERVRQGVEIRVPDRAGVPAYAFDRDALILASDAAFLEAVIDTTRELRPSILRDVGYLEMESALPDGRLVSAYADLRAIVEGDGPRDDLAALSDGDLGAVDGLGLSVSAEPGGLAVDVAARIDRAALSQAALASIDAPEAPNELLGLVPAEALGVVSLRHVDVMAEVALGELVAASPRQAPALERLGLTGEDGFLARLTGDVAIEAVREDDGLAGAAVLGVHDPPAAARDLERLLGRVAQPDPRGGVGRDLVWRTATIEGVRVRVSREPVVAIAATEAAVVVATTPAHAAVIARARGPSIVASDAFVRATAGLPSDDGMVFVDVQAVARAVRDGLGADERERFDEVVMPWLRSIRAVAFGAGSAGTLQRARLLIQVASPGGPG
jgi:hypothetical protein